MSRHANLSAKHAPVANLGRTGHADLGRHHGILANFAVVGNLDEVVKLHAPAHIGAAHRGAVNAGICADFHVVLNGYDADLRYFLISVWRGGETEAVGTDHSAGMERHAVAELATVVNRGVGENHAIFAKTCTLLDDSAGIDLATFANGDVIADISKRAYVAVFAHRGSRRNTSKRLNARALALCLLIKGKKPCDALVGIVHAYQRRLHLFLGHKVAVDEHDARFSVVYIVRIVHVGKE